MNKETETGSMGLVSQTFNGMKKELSEPQIMHVEFLEIKGNRAVFISHELKKRYYIELDQYDLENTSMESSYPLQYIPEGWGRHKIYHNDKIYDLYEI